MSLSVVSAFLKKLSYLKNTCFEWKNTKYELKVVSRFLVAVVYIEEDFKNDETTDNDIYL